MPITVPQVCQMSQCVKRLLLLMGLGDDNLTYSETVRSEAYANITAVKDALLQADFEICEIIINTIGHPYRAKFFTETPAALNHGDRIPAHLGKIGEPFLVIDGANQLPRLAKNLDHVLRTRKHPEIYGTPDDSIYFIEDERVFFAGESEQIFVPVPTLQKNVAGGGVLQSPLAYEQAVITSAAPYLFTNEQNMEARPFFLEQSQAYKQMIANGSTALPEIARIQG